MYSWFTSFYKKTSTKEVLFTSLGVIFGITFIRSLGLLQPIEWTAYDSMFFFRPREPIDERIVIVAWDEADIQMGEQGIMSDNTLATTLEKIRTQQPRIIGLDIYRDVPVTSHSLSDKQNERAYQRLIEIMESTPNLVGIEKVLPRVVNPPIALKNKEQTAAADLLYDDDGTIRRAYIHPLENEKGGPWGTPTLGVVLASGYLVLEGYEVGEIKSTHALTLTNPETSSQIILEPLKTLDGSYTRTEDGTLFLVNWRKQRFPVVYVSDVATGNIPPDIFRDKIVLIGNTSASGSDKHHLPINRWSSPQFTNGVEVHAQITSSIISAAIDSRPLIKTIPEAIEITMLTVVVVGISLIAEKYRKICPETLFLVTLSGAVVIISVLTISSFIAFTEGYWIPIVPSVLGVLGAGGTISLIIYINTIRRNNRDFKQLIKDLNHSLQNPLRSITENGKTAYELSSILSTAYEEDNLTEKIEELYEELEESPISALQEHLDALLVQTAELNRQRNNAQEYFSIAYLGKNIFQRKATALNQLINTSVCSIIPIKQSQYQFPIKLVENYDPTIKEVSIDSIGISRVLENLIDNAYYAIKLKIKKIPQHQGIITIQTWKENNRIKVSVSDNGIGMPREMVNRIFIPFKSFKPRNQGQGLGLSLASETMARHDGNITVGTKDGEGSKFILDFPGK